MLKLTTYLSLLLILAVGFFFIVSPVLPAEKVPWWPVQSIDTMKFSRDLASAKISDPTFDKIIDSQLKTIAQTRATHVAIGTPYDERFLPFLRRWVKFARQNNLHVWFRGNFAGWEGWFGEKAITRDQHLQKLAKFITKNPDLFADGDIFSSCPECENGGPGDPRKTGDVLGHRLFLISQYQIAKESFAKINKKVAANYFSMNADVARLIMDPATTKALDKLVVIDHYVPTPEQLLADVKDIAAASHGQVFLGEFGVPIPDINGSMTESEQAKWLDSALSKLEKSPAVAGLNYWVGYGGSTQLWNGNESPRLAAGVLQKYFSPKIISGQVMDQFGNPIRNAKVQDGIKVTHTDRTGHFSLPVIFPANELEISAKGYTSLAYQINENDNNLKIVIDKKSFAVFDHILGFINSLFAKITGVLRF